MRYGIYLNIYAAIHKFSLNKLIKNYFQSFIKDSIKYPSFKL